MTRPALDRPLSPWWALLAGEAMLAVVLAEAAMEKFGGDHLSETLRNFGTYQTSELH